MSSLSEKILSATTLAQPDLLAVPQTAPHPKAVWHPHWFCRTCSRATTPIKVGSERVCGFSNCQSTKLVFNS
jgi:hypothetical protein